MFRSENLISLSACNNHYEPESNLRHMSTFLFNIRTGAELQTIDDVKRTFTQDINCCVGYFSDESVQCHV